MLLSNILLKSHLDKSKNFCAMLYLLTLSHKLIAFDFLRMLLAIILADVIHINVEMEMQTDNILE